MSFSPSASPSIADNDPPDQQAIETLLSLAEQYTGHAQNVAQQSKGTVKGAHDDDHLRIAETDLKVNRLHS